MDLTREGWLEPWARLRDSEDAERMRLDSMPAFDVYNSVGDLKPAANAVLVAYDETEQTFPLLTTQRFGRGRTAAHSMRHVISASVRQKPSSSKGVESEDC